MHPYFEALNNFLTLTSKTLKQISNTDGKNNEAFVSGGTTSHDNQHAKPRRQQADTTINHPWVTQIIYVVIRNHRDMRRIELSEQSRFHIVFLYLVHQSRGGRNTTHGLKCVLPCGH